MSKFKRFKDSITGLFVTPAHAGRNESTTTEVDIRGLSPINQKILVNALEDEQLQSRPIIANKILRNAIERVLDLQK